MSSTIKQAIILAAGRGSRLSPDDGGASKALIKLGNETIIDYQIRTLESLGVTDFMIVTGFKADEVKGHLAGHHAQTVHNPDYAATNSLYSLCLAADAAMKGCVILNSDVLFHASLLANLLHDPAPNAILVDFDRHLDEEEMKVAVDSQNIVTAIGKWLKPEPGMGENVGIIKLGAEAAPVFFAESRKLLDSGDVKAWAPRGIHLLIGKKPFTAVPVGGIPWTEIDFPQDLDHARNVIYPMCVG